MHILTEKIHFSETEIERRLHQLDPTSNYEVQKQVFYPYLIFEYVIDRGGFFQPLKGNIGCTIDGVNEIGALADTFPKLIEQNVSDGDVIQSTLERDDAEHLAIDFLNQSIASKKKVLTIPKLTPLRNEMFYRPYWVVGGKTRTSNPFLITVDAISGKFHPL